MFKRFGHSKVLISCIAFLVVYTTTSVAFGARKSAGDLAKINKQIEEKEKASARLEKQKLQIEGEIRSTQKKMVAIANNVKDYERKLYDYDKQLSVLKARERDLNKKIEANNDELIKIIAVFENIALVPRGYLWVSPTKIDIVFNSSILLRTIVDELNISKKHAADDLNELIALRDSINKAKASISSLNTKVKAEKNKIASLIRTKKATQKKLDAEQLKTKKEMKKLIAESKTIEEFLKKAERLRREREAKQKTAKSNNFAISTKATGSKPLPVPGVISTYFGGERTSGVKSKGIYIKTLASSQVISPTDADVVFSGSFYGYRNLLILHTNDNHYIIMGGLSSVYAEEGQSFLAGEPIGETGTSEFYIEIRSGETPINPLQYFKV